MATVALYCMFTETLCVRSVLMAKCRVRWSVIPVNLDNTQAFILDIYVVM